MSKKIYIKQVYYPFTEWEDYKNGMYATSNDEKLIKYATNLLCDKVIFYRKAKEMVSEWKISAEVNLTNLSTNRKSWIGQATCCYVHKVPESLTRLAWNSMHVHQQKSANSVAEKIIKEWESNYLDNEQERIKF